MEERKHFSHCVSQKWSHQFNILQCKNGNLRLDLLALESFNTPHGVGKPLESFSMHVGSCCHRGLKLTFV